jgi:hypothetical protein
MKLSTAEAGTKTEREVAEKLATGKAEKICGAIIERNDPTNTLNLRVNLDAIHAEAVRIAKARRAA